jgi:hypothetical protein
LLANVVVAGCIIIKHLLDHLLSISMYMRQNKYFEIRGGNGDNEQLLAAPTRQTIEHLLGVEEGGVAAAFWPE